MEGGLIFFTCGQCGQRKEIVSFRADGFVKGVINVPKQIPLCRECVDVPKKAEVSPEQEYDDNAPF